MSELKLLRSMYRTSILMRDGLSSEDELNVAIDAVTKFITDKKHPPAQAPHEYLKLPT